MSSGKDVLEQERIFNMKSLITNEKTLKHSRKKLKKSKKPYIAKINGRIFYNRTSWLQYLDKCLGLND